MAKNKDEVTFLLLDLPRQMILDIQRYATEKNITVDEWMNEAIKTQLTALELSEAIKEQFPKEKNCCSKSGCSKSKSARKRS